MSPAEIVTVCVLLLLFVQGEGKQHSLYNERWFIATMIMLIGSVIVGLFGAMKGFW